MKLSSKFLGSGISSPLKVSEGLLETAGDEESVRQSIKLILGTAPGERVMRPSFGCGIHDLVFAIANATTAARATAEVRRALLKWEPRINIIDIKSCFRGEGTRLDIEVDYRIRETNSRDNLVYPFYLEGRES